MTNEHDHQANSLILKRLGIDTHQEAVVYMRADCPICRSEGFQAHSRVQVITPHRTIIATLNMIHDSLLSHHEAGLSEAAWKRLSPQEGETAFFAHAPSVTSLSAVRAKLYGHRLSDESLQAIIQDVVGGKYTDIELSSFISACVGDRLDRQEIIGLTKAMIQAGEKIHWEHPLIVDKHSIGGLPGNRTTPIVVAIVTAAGLIMPKTSSRAITSPAGTADTMATLTNINLDLPTLQQVVEKEGGCLAWGGSIHLSPADDILIRIERALDVDSEGQLVASILSKKAAAGSTHVVIDMPVGPTAKVRTLEMATVLKEHLEQTGKAIGLKVHVMMTDGTQPVGRGIGPALEALDVLSVLKREKDAPQDLREKSLLLAAKIFTIAKVATQKESYEMAREILDEGRAWIKFQAICEAQGGFHFPQKAAFTHDVLATTKGTVLTIDNRKLAKVAKLAGAPESGSAGIVLHSPLKQQVEKGKPLFTIHAETHGELNYALNYVIAQNNIITIVQEAE
jgi:thymidine phosphorylase